MFTTTSIYLIIIALTPIINTLKGPNHPLTTLALQAIHQQIDDPNKLIKRAQNICRSDAKVNHLEWYNVFRQVVADKDIEIRYICTELFHVLDYKKGYCYW